MWREKEFWPKHSQPHPPLFLIIPRLLVVVTATINEQKLKQNDLIHYYYSKLPYSADLYCSLCSLYLSAE